LLARTSATLPHWDVVLDLLVPCDRGEIIALAHQKARVLESEYEEDGTRIRLVATDRIARTIQAALLGSPPPGR
jgi:GTP-binding protein HflX